MGAPIPHPVTAVAVATPVDPSALPHALDPSAVDPRALEAPMLAHLRETLGAANVESWFLRLQLERFEPRPRGVVAVASVTTRFLKSWIEGHFVSQLHDALHAAIAPLGLGPTLTVEIVVRGSGKPCARPVPRPVPDIEPDRARDVAETRMPAAAPPTMLQVPAPGERDAPIPDGFVDPAATFAAFVTGDGNRAARGAALAMAERSLFANPLVLVGPPGTGKTHLAMAAVTAVRERGGRAVYLDALRLMACVKPGVQSPAIDRLVAADLIAVDDLAAVRGPGFGTLLRAALAAWTPLLLTAAQPPHEMEHLDETLRSRLAGGPVLSIRAPVLAERATILEHLAMRAAASPVATGVRSGAARRDFHIPAEIRDAIAEAAHGDVRLLQGAVAQLALQFDLGAMPAGPAEALALMPALTAQRSQSPIQIAAIQRAVAEFFDVRVTDICSSRRTANIVRPRQVAMYLSKDLTLRSLPEIGRRFGGRDHTTVLHAVRKIAGLVQTDAALRDDVESLRRALVARA